MGRERAESEDQDERVESVCVDMCELYKISAQNRESPHQLVDRSQAQRK